MSLRFHYYLYTVLYTVPVKLALRISSDAQTFGNIFRGRIRQSKLWFFVAKEAFSPIEIKLVFHTVVALNFWERWDSFEFIYDLHEITRIYHFRQIGHFYKLPCQLTWCIGFGWWKAQVQVWQGDFSNLWDSRIRILLKRINHPGFLQPSPCCRAAVLLRNRIGER